MSKNRSLLLALAAAAMLYAFLFAIPREMIYQPVSPIVRTPADMDLLYEDVVLYPADRSIALAGWWMASSEPIAAMVFIHGAGSNRDSAFFEALKFYRAMVERGVSVLAIDLRNHGASGSDGRGVQFGLTEQADVTSAIDWVSQRAQGLPLFAMGISMGGAAVIHAAARGAPPIDGLILLDPLLDTHSALGSGAWVASGLPPGLFKPAGWAATSFHGLPEGDDQALAIAARLELPMLLIQDPTDPVTQAIYARQLAQENANVTFWMAPETPADHPDIAWRERWGSHVAAYALYPGETLAQIMGFISGVAEGLDK